jgi:FKBP-type peptidyl-prolyl cis-trans isomerase 2
MNNGRRRAPAPRVVVCALALVLPTVTAAEEAPGTSRSEEGSVVVEKGKKVSIEYTLTLDDGTQVETNVGGEPLEFEQGAGQIIPGLEEGIAGMKPGEQKTIRIAPEKAYGPVHPEAFQEVELAKLPEGARKVGTMLVARDAAGNQHPVRVAEVKADKAVIDFNHPLAGKTLTFNVKVLQVR